MLEKGFLFSVSPMTSRGEQSIVWEKFTQIDKAYGTKNAFK
jgi:hypothetical protein